MTHNLGLQGEWIHILYLQRRYATQMIACKRRSLPYRTNSFIVAWRSALLAAKCFTRTVSLGLHHLKGTGKQSPSLASHVELIFFAERVCWAARPMGRTVLLFLALWPPLKNPFYAMPSMRDQTIPPPYEFYKSSV